MLNIEQELELGRGWDGYEAVNARYEDAETKEIIVVDLKRKGRDSIYDYGWRFWAKTGVMVGHEGEGDMPNRIRPKSQTVPVTHFFLFAGHREWGKESWVKIESEKFSAPTDAAERMKHHNGLFTTSMSPFRVMMKKEVELSEVKDYPAWAEFRFASGEWLKLPWHDEPWANQYPEHHAHLSVQDNCQVAFWDGEYNAQTDEITVMAPGRYLQRYFSDVLSPTQIRDWAVKVDVECELKFVADPDGIVEIYTRPNSPSSCMKYHDDSSDWACGMNPTRVYGAGDLQLAYLERKGKVVARALVWPEKMVAGRRYGDIERLTDALKDAGYKMDSEDSSAYGRGTGGFDGARLLLIRPDDHPGNFVMPYVDAGYRANRLPEAHADFEKFLVLSKSGTIQTTRTDGLASDPDDDDCCDYTCDACDEGMYADDAFHLDDNTYCETCYDSRTECCDRCSDTFRQGNGHTVDEDNTWCSSCYSNHATSCDYCHDSVSCTNPVYDATYTQGEEDPDVHKDACQSCLDNDDDIQEDVNGRWIDVSTATHCEACGSYFSAELEAETACPNQLCTEQRAANTQTEELEAA